MLERAIKINPFAIKYGSAEARNLPALAHLAVSLDWRALAYVSASLRSADRTLAALAISQSGWAFKFLVDPIRNERDVLAKAFAHKPWARRYLEDPATLCSPMLCARALGHSSI